MDKRINIATSPTQSARLLACGIDPKSADMCYVGGWEDACVISFLMCDKEDTPAWSLSALLALLPKEIYDNNEDTYYFELSQCSPLTDEYYVQYQPAWFEGSALYSLHDNCPIEACVQMIECLTANRHKL